MYFKNFNVIEYDYTIKSDKNPMIEYIVDISQRVQLELATDEFNLLTLNYIVKDGETPEIISYNLYNEPYYHWTILYINNISNINKEWPLSATALKKFAIKKYGSEAALNNIHHYEDIDTGIIADYSFLVSQKMNPLLVSNMDYEERKNEMKRNIKVIKPSQIGNFVDLFMKELKRVNQ